jgi:hypothetical protein
MGKSCIPGKEASYVAREALERCPIGLAFGRSPRTARRSSCARSGPQSTAAVRKPSPLHDQCLAPTADLEGHRKRLREAFGDTLSDEFVDVILGKLSFRATPRLTSELTMPKDPMLRPTSIAARQPCQGPTIWGADPRWPSLQAGSGQGAGAVPNARWGTAFVRRPQTATSRLIELPAAGSPRRAHEIKQDGYRLIARKRDGRVRRGHSGRPNPGVVG